jgi:hypothetical protein
VRVLTCFAAVAATSTHSSSFAADLQSRNGPEMAAKSPEIAAE